MDALDRPAITIDDVLAGRRPPAIPVEWDRDVAALFLGLTSPRAYTELVSSLTEGRTQAAETFAVRWAQHAVQVRLEQVLHPAVLAASVRTPVRAGSDDATPALAVVVRAIQISSWDAQAIVDWASGVLDSARLKRLVRMTEYETPVLEVAGLTESMGPDGWRIS